MSSGQQAPTIDPSAIRAQVERIAGSPPFQNSERMARFLRFVVEKTLAGEAAGIKA